LRWPCSSLVTCSDASETGGGTCCSSVVTPRGRALLNELRGRSEAKGRDRVALIESFGGIGGGRHAFELLDVEVACHIHVELSESARRVSEHAWPGAIVIPYIKELTFERLREVLQDYPRVDSVIQIGGPPCQEVSGLNAAGVGAHGPRSGLRLVMSRVQGYLQRMYPRSRCGIILENVASMSREAQEAYNRQMGSLPVRICPSSFSCYRRPRLFWIDFELYRTPGAKVEEGARWTDVKLLGPRPPLRAWLPRWWRAVASYSTWPTFVQAIKRKKPPYKPAGLKGCDQQTLARWEQHQFRYPPYQYKLHYMLRDPQGKLRTMPAVSREVLLGFRRDHTYVCFSANLRRQHPESWEDERCSLLGNSFCVPGVAWLLAHWLVKTGCLAAVPSVEELVQRAMSDPPRRPSPCEASLELCRRIMLLQTHRGGEVYGILGPSGKKFAFKAVIDSGYWQWKTVVRSRWKTKEHINVLEARAYVGSLRWRARRERPASAAALSTCWTLRSRSAPWLRGGRAAVAYSAPCGKPQL